MSINLKEFDRKTRILLNELKTELNFTVGQITVFGPKILNKSIKETLKKEKRLRHVIPHVDKFNVKTNNIMLPVVGKGYAIRFIKKQQIYKIRLTVTKSNVSAKVFWSLAVAKGGRRALGPADLKKGKSFFGVRLRPGDITSISAAQQERLRIKGFVDGDKLIVPMAQVGPVKPYFDWIFTQNLKLF